MDNHPPVTFPRLKENECSGLRDIDLEIQIYVGPVSPEMPVSFKFNALPLKILCTMVIDKEDVFLKQCAIEDYPLEYSGFLTSQTRLGSGSSYRKVTCTTFNSNGTKKVTIFPTTDIDFAEDIERITGDQQIHKVTVNVKWQYGEKFKDLYPILGGMHTEISSAGCIGYLMAGSGLAELM